MSNGELYAFQLTEDTYIYFAGDGNVWRYMVVQNVISDDGMSGVINTLERKETFSSRDSAAQDAWREYVIGELFPVVTREGKVWMIKNWGVAFKNLFKTAKPVNSVNLN